MLAFWDQYEMFQIVQAVTTREEREDDIQGDYQHLTKKEFENLYKKSKLLIKSEYRRKYYGITHEAVQQVINNGKIPLLIITPKAVGELEEKGNKKRDSFFTIFLDATDDTLNKRLEQRKEESDENVKKQRKEDREYAKICRYIVDNSNNVQVENVTQLLYSLWEYRTVGGMLSKRMIGLMMNCGMLIENPNFSYIQGASYDLFLGDRYWQNGEIRNLDDNNPFIKLYPGDYVIVSSKEIVNLPRDIAGEFDLTVSLFCQGVILSNGPQVDPGFNGRLFCLLFNTSDTEISLRRNRHYATLEFNKLIEPTTSYSGKYQGKRDIIDYLPWPSKPSTIIKLGEDIEELKKIKWYEKTLPIILSLLANVVAFVSIVIVISLFYVRGG